MSNRKREILDVAIKLFNEKGCINTSTRHIADDLGISVGNLYYYFKNKEEIIIYIYQTFMDEVSTRITLLKDDDIAFDYYEFLIDQMDFELNYRFIRLEMNNIISKYPSVKEAFQKGIQIKLKQMKNLFLHQIKYGYIKEIEDIELEFIISNSWIIITQWEIFWIINNIKDERVRREKGVLNLLYFMKPYLTTKGLENSNLLTSIKYLEKGTK
ncbi:TetR/AcrR family transcriptional regulator [Arcobacteraceae bacterium]|nr:TetR/AcrR family transcriptional regulator [Arcobacteraceae bacterium]